MLQLESSGVTAEPPSVSVWLEVICDPFIVQSISEPLLLRQRMSDLLSPLKSPMPATLQELSGVAALPPKVTCCEAVTCEPFIVQSMSDPSVLRHKMSDLPSPLKSPMPATLQELSGVAALPPKLSACEEVIWEPFMVQSTSVPFWLRHKRSVWPSPLKSPTPATFQVELGCARLP